MDAAWLTMILGWFPPSQSTRREQPTGGVSVDVTAHLHVTALHLADGEWLGARFESERGADGLALERGRIHSPTGAVLAESFHTRWTGRWSLVPATTRSVRWALPFSTWRCRTTTT